MGTAVPTASTDGCPPVNLLGANVNGIEVTGRGDTSSAALGLGAPGGVSDVGIADRLFIAVGVLLCDGDEVGISALSLSISLDISSRKSDK